MTISWSPPVPLTARIDFPDLSSGSGLGIWVSASITPNWGKIGYYQIEASIDGEFFKLEPKRLEFGKSLIRVPYRTYKLSIIPVPNLIAIYPLISVQIAQIDTNTMSINYQNTERQTGAIVDTTVAGAVASFQVLAADPLRHSGTIYNQTNRALYIRWGTTAATTANLLVPAGANLVIPEDYTGAVQGISTAGVTGNVLSQTVSFV
jgi:hypothetical protein